MEYTPGNYDDAAGFTNYLFEQFEVSQVRGFDDVVKFDSSMIPSLLKTIGHIDLYLRPKA